MNKVLMSLVVGGLAVGPALALPSMSALKSACSGTTVNGVCMKDPCKSGDGSLCVRDFADIGFGFSDGAFDQRLQYVRIYLTTRNIAYEGLYNGDDVPYVIAALGNGEYMSFEFDYPATNWENYVLAAGRAYDVKCFYDDGAIAPYCEVNGSEELCQDIADLTGVAVGSLNGTICEFADKDFE